MALPCHLLLVLLSFHAQATPVSKSYSNRPLGQDIPVHVVFKNGDEDSKLEPDSPTSSPQVGTQPKTLKPPF